MEYDYDLLVIGSGPGGQKAAIAGAKLGRRVGDRRAQAHGRRRVHQHRHDPVQDPARGRALPHRPDPAGVLRPVLPGQGGHHGRRPDLPDPARDRPGDRRHPQPAGPQPRAHARRHRPVHRSATRSWCSPTTATSSEYTAREVHRRGRHQAGPAVHRGLRRADRRRLRPDPRHGPRAAVDGRGRRRRHRHRVRVDVRRARHQGDRGRAARPDAGVLRPGDHRGAEVPAARPGGDVPVPRVGGQGRAARGRHADPAGERQADPRRHGHVLGRSPGRHRGARAWTRPASRRTTAAGSRSTTTTAPRSRTSTRSATSSASPRSPRPRWSRAGARPTTPAASRSRRR